MLLSLFTNWWDDWKLYHKCIFDGHNKLIFINPNETEIEVKRDIYSAWKEWASLRDHAKFAPAVRSIGGDPIGSGQFAGDLYFLINGWRLYIDHSCNVDGSLFSDDFPSPFIQPQNTQIVTSKVSSLVNIVATESIGGIVVPSAEQIRQEIDANSTKLQQIADKQNEALTKNDYIALS